MLVSLAVIVLAVLEVAQSQGPVGATVWLVLALVAGILALVSLLRP